MRGMARKAAQQRVVQEWYSCRERCHAAPHARAVLQAKCCCYAASERYREERWCFKHGSRHEGVVYKSRQLIKRKLPWDRRRTTGQYRRSIPPDR
ncbi:hypothetical protein AVEN_241889-1 [Araneus ventricosus]|uniref:Uncharacterized protein n=1 Tax=Araneus ventricosus TaxID=182803 RepID=A0A4Y2WTC7_ARAVE|nr:hypothetical protein AVEN_241889-1 [Araneus ventricosus]